MAVANRTCALGPPSASRLMIDGDIAMPDPSYQPIACDIYDYLEIACMHHEPLHIELHDGSKLDGHARNVRAHEHIEYLDLQIGQQMQSLRLDAIAYLSSTASPPRFARVAISPAPS